MKSIGELFAEILVRFVKPVLRFLFGKIPDDSILTGLGMVIFAAIAGAVVFGMVRREGWRWNSRLMVIFAVMAALAGVAKLAL